MKPTYMYNSVTYTNRNDLSGKKLAITLTKFIYQYKLTSYELDLYMKLELSDRMNFQTKSYFKTSLYSFLYQCFLS